MINSQQISHIVLESLEQVSYIFLMSLLWTLDKFHALFQCLYHELRLNFTHYFSVFVINFEHGDAFLTFFVRTVHLFFPICSEAVVRRCSIKKGFLKNFVKFTGKHLCQSLFLNAGLRSVTLLRVLTGKMHPEIKLQRLREIRIWTFGLLVNQINSF